MSGKAKVKAGAKAESPGASSGSAMRTSLILNVPYEEPCHHWRHEGAGGIRMEGTRRKSAFVRHGTVGFGRRRRPVRVEKELELVNAIRPRVREWREAGLPGATAVSRELLSHWRERGKDDKRLFFCQLEAAETMMWLSESADGRRAAEGIAGDGGPFPRLCAKLATGTGKTVVMAMLAAWQTLNHLSSPGDGRFSRDILAVAPGLTVRRRLSVIVPGSPGNYYDLFDLIPPGLESEMNAARVRVINWHALAADKGAVRSVDKRGPKSDEAWTRDVLAEMRDANRLLVFNDEAHHAWRSESASADDPSTIWIQGLDRLHRTRGILRCYDFSATPFVSSGGAADVDSVFNWVVSDFGLNDAIEAGLVKIPRLVARDDAMADPATGRSKLWHIYPHVSENLRRRAAAETDPLPALLTQAYAQLGADWSSDRDSFRKAKRETPPVMISVVGDIKAAKRVENALKSSPALRGCAPSPEQTLRVDSSAMEKDDGGREAEAIREQAATVGDPNGPGAKLEHVISVAMLSEGWDAKTVTHIMGLRAFTSQLLCEQVVGRGLRRMSYETDEEGFFQPEFVNVFGVPFDLALQGSPDDKNLPRTAAEKTLIHPVEDKRRFEISWPRVLRVNASFSRRLKEPDWSRTKPLVVRGSDTPLNPEMAALLDSRSPTGRGERLRLENLERQYRMQTLAFKAAADVARNRAGQWGGEPGALAAQLVLFAEKFVRRGVEIRPKLPPGEDNDRKRRLLVGLSFDRILARFADLVESENTERAEVVLDRRTVGSTGEMRPWYTGRQCAAAEKSHINFCPWDSAWEEQAAKALDNLDAVAAWAKNDHLNFEIFWSNSGAPRKFRPDFLVRLRDGRMLILEIKGMGLALPELQEETAAKKRAAEHWVKGVNSHGKFGEWLFRQAEDPDEAEEIIRGLDKQGDD